MAFTRQRRFAKRRRAIICPFVRIVVKGKPGAMPGCRNGQLHPEANPTGRNRESLASSFGGMGVRVSGQFKGAGTVSVSNL